MLNLAGAVILSGIVIVFIVLVLLIVIVTATGKVIMKMDLAKKNALPATLMASSAKAPPPARKAPTPPPAPVVQAGIQQETVAVISAAVAAMMDEQSPGTPYMVESIGRRPNRQGRPVWGFAGMQQNTRPF